MATVSVAAHNHFFEHTFSGYPFQGYYETEIAGLAVRHSSTHHVDLIILFIIHNNNYSY